MMGHFVGHIGHYYDVDQHSIRTHGTLLFNMIHAYESGSHVVTLAYMERSYRHFLSHVS